MWKSQTVVIANDIDLDTFLIIEKDDLAYIYTDCCHELYDIQLLLGFCKW